MELPTPPRARRACILILLTLLAGAADAAAGRTPGTATVTLRGEAAYSLPLRLPPGTNGMTPTLSLEYRHHQAGGIAGVGWSIGGLSRIERCARTVAQDGSAGPVSQFSTDRFCLDGERLVVVDGHAYGAPGAEYRTEVESFARIRSWGSAGTGPAYFVVEDAAGRVLEYGATTNSRIDTRGVQANGTLTARAWALNQVRDRSGNVIRYEYTKDVANGSYRIAAIRYNQNPGAGVAASHAVAFVYGSRPVNDVDASYVAGTPVRQVVRLDRIDVLYNGAVVRHYDLAYEPSLSSTGRSRLASVSECGVGGSDCLAPTVFRWQDGVPGLAAEMQLAAGALDTLATDVDGDGRDDLVWAAGTSTSQTLRYRLSLAGGGFGPEHDTGARTVSGAGVPLDYNGDGHGDILVMSPAGQWLLLPGGAAGLTTPVATGLSAAGVIDFRGADMNGDGLDDLAYSTLEGQTLVVQVRYAQAGGTFSTNPVTVYDQGMAAGYEWPEGGDFLGARGQRIDLDGDGRDDLLMNEYYTMARISADQSTSDYFDGTFYGGTPADINGDGCTDFVYLHYTGRWRVRFSGCQVLWWPAPELIGPPAVGVRALAFDWNGDGRDDVLFRTASPAWQVMASNGSGLLPAVSTGAAHGNAGAAFTGDFNGDGLQDLATVVGGQPRIRLQNGPRPDLLRSATDGFGVSAVFEYAALTSGLHTRLGTARYPDRDLQDTRAVVAALSVSDGTASGALTTRRYRYEGLRHSGIGRGDLGFARRYVTDETPDHAVTMEHVVRQDFPFIGRVERQALRRASGQLLGERAGQWSALAYGGAPAQRFFPYLSAVTEKHYALGGAYDGVHHTTMTRVVAAVDHASGLVTDSTTTVGEVATGLAAGSFRSERLLHTSVMNDSANWCLGRPQATQAIASHALPGGSAVTRTTSQAWDGIKCRPLQQQLEPGSSQWQVTIGYGYDAFGNMSSRVLTGAGMEPRATTLAWGPRGQLPVSTANALGHVSTVTWDYALGVPLSRTDPNALTTAWGYDGHGRLVEETRPDQTRTRWERAACAGGCDARTRYVLLAHEHDSAGVLQHAHTAEVDSFDRPYRIATPRAGGGLAVTTTDSDARGRPRRQVLPHWQGGPGTGHRQFTYDLLDRVTSETWHDASGAVDRSWSFTYDGLATAITDPLGRRHARVASAWGDVVRVTDALGGNASYQYDALGRLTAVTDPLGNVVGSVAYNARGMRTLQSDVDLGTWSFTPNALGETVSQTDAAGRVSSFTYDKLSRLLTRHEPEGLTTWAWGSSVAARNVGQLVSVSGPGHSEAHAYDAWGRPATRTITSDETYQYAYSYNGQGLLDTLTYPASTGGYRLRLGFDYAAGQVVRVRDRNHPSTVLWELNAQDAAGHAIHETLGTTIGVVTGYHPLSGLVEYRQAGLGGDAALQHLSWEWDAAGNLAARRDLNLGSAESFDYDALDRLVRVRLDGVPGVELRYDALGNITWKSDVGPYAYDPARRHAVTAAGAGSFAYDANGNMTQRHGAALSWFSYNRPAALRTADGRQSQFWYAPDRSRWRQVATGAGPTETTVYVGGLMEKVTVSGVTSYRHYVPAPTGVAALYVRRSGGGPAEATYYLTRDHLGSPDKVLDAAGVTTTLAASFDAFGRRRGSDWRGSPDAATLAAIAGTTRDGFTGHEHLDNLGLVHMNGRVYDPVIARFLSADPHVQAPFDSQSLNRYAYALNNPLSFVDPSGFVSVGAGDVCEEGHCTPPGTLSPADSSRQRIPWYLYGLRGSGQVASQALRDPCGQDGSAMACHQPRGGPVAASATAPVAAEPASREPFYSRLLDTTLDAIPGWHYSGLASGALSNQDYPLALAFYGAMTAEVLGPAGPAVLAAKRAVASVGGVVRRFEQEGARTYYRVYSGEATRGKWLTAVPFRSSVQAQEALALPPWNGATHIQEVLVPHGTLLERSRALPVGEWQRFRGGAEQFKLLEAIPEANFGPGRPLP